MSIYLNQAKKILNKVELEDSDVVKAREILNSFDGKTAGLFETISDPRLSNAISLLTPFTVNYKVNQVLRLLKELAKEEPKVDPRTGVTKFI